MLRRDHYHANKIQRQSFSYHLRDGDVAMAAAEHDDVRRGGGIAGGFGQEGTQ
ncbi:MAG: hypothetical protein MRJ52_08325 [Nitrosomonas sp.]|nr:hypothetical protein [Nitrosomonas sp.]